MTRRLRSTTAWAVLIAAACQAAAQSTPTGTRPSQDTADDIAQYYTTRPYGTVQTTQDTAPPPPVLIRPQVQPDDAPGAPPPADPPPALRPQDLRSEQAAPPPPPQPESVGKRFDDRNESPGVHVGPWKVTPSGSLRGGYDDNVTTVTDDPVSSAFIDIRGRVDAVNETPTNSYSAYLELRHSLYTDVDDYDHFGGSAGGNFNVQVSQYVRIRGAIGVAYTEEPDSANEGIVTDGVFDPYVDLSSYLSIPVSLGGRYQSGRWFVDGSVDTVYADYSDRTTRGGTRVDQRFKNGTTTDFRLRTGWEFSPAVRGFVEGTYNLQRFEDETADSDGWRAVAGMEFELSRLIIGEIYAGYASQSYDATGETNGFTYGGSLDWYMTQLLSIHLEAKRDFSAERSTFVDGIGRTEPVIRDSVRLGLEYEPLRQLLVRANAGWEGAKYEADGRKDDRIFGSLGLDYVFTPNFHVTLDYLHEETSSDVAGDSSRNVVTLGITAKY